MTREEFNEQLEKSKTNTIKEKEKSISNLQERIAFLKAAEFDVPDQLIRDGMYANIGKTDLNLVYTTRVSLEEIALVLRGLNFKIVSYNYWGVLHVNYEVNYNNQVLNLGFRLHPEGEEEALRKLSGGKCAITYEAPVAPSKTIVCAMEDK